MEKLLEVLEQCTGFDEIRIVTILDGEISAQKALIKSGDIYWSSSKKMEEFIKENLDDIEAGPLCGCMEVKNVRIFTEKLRRNAKIVICGGGHVAVALTQTAQIIGIPVIVLDDRAEYAEAVKKLGAAAITCESFEEGLSRVNADKETYFVIATRAHEYDQVCLEKISTLPHAYIGMMGSKKRISVVKDLAIANGADKSVIESIHSPIGLDIHAETPQEIAISIMAEIISEKSKRKAGEGFAKEIANVVKSRTNTKQMVLAQIISKKGSAPRKEGTKMLIMNDGSIVQTIGGGKLEADIIEKAKVLMNKQDEKIVLFKANLNTGRVEREGMVCGGEVEVFLEKIE